MIVLGSTMSNPNEHSHAPVPMLVAGGMSGRLKGNRHLVFPDRTPHSNLLLSLINKAEIPMESFGNSTGALEIRRNSRRGLRDIRVIRGLLAC